MRILTIVTILFLFGRVSIADDSLQDLIAALEQEESHYENLQLELTSVYAVAEDAEVGFDPNYQEHLQTEERTSILLQGEQFRVQTTTTSYTVLEDGTSEVIDVFDGQTRRYFWQNSSTRADTTEVVRSDSGGMVTDELPSLTNLARPHMFLLESGCPEVPLSTYMSGHEAVLARPNPGPSTGSGIEVVDLGTEVFNGLNCRRILIDSIFGEERHNGWELWLAEERNLIPVRNISYTYRWSTEIPVAEKVVDEWQELRPGVWFPIKAHTVRYDSFAVSEGRQQLSWRKDYEVHDVSLEPEITTTTFTQLEFPPGTQVRVLENGEEVPQ